ncbi:p-aminobenzoyl-glutamate hydrolase subunit B [Peribacillus sp. Bi96]|uniref:hypothetical protein n=1 Tax=Peribacillus sp. Bi96 TaxID=2884273 RepID=UPI001D9676E1|nr:hypothetical protein [Peribacillus sp. Bi96]CAH0280096.1 p-aminobenzoyl-glutamate hydrolase subunit B [Peribacillus sp. Bi96]
MILFPIYIIPNHTLEKVMYKNFKELGVPNFDESEKKFAAEIQRTLTEQEKGTGLGYNVDGELKAAIMQLRGKSLSDLLLPYNENMEKIIMPGSTDVGDVSWIVPTAQCSTVCLALGTQLHTWQAVATGTTSIAHKGMLHAGKVMAATAAEVMQNPELIKQANQELQNRLGGESYVCPIPKDVMPTPLK